MKKIKLLLLAAALLCAAFSCEKAEAPKSSMEPEMVSLILSTEKSTKTHISNVTDANGVTEIHWDQGDQIAVFTDTDPLLDDNKNTFSMQGSPNGNFARFSGSVNRRSKKIWAVYPNSEASSCNQDGTQIKVNISSSQVSSAGSFEANRNISVAKSPITETSGLGKYELTEPIFVNFKNVCALLKFTAPANASEITSVTISANEVIAGEMIIDYSADEPKVTGVSGSKSITMTGSFEADKEYYFVVAPVSISGISMTIQANGETRYIAKKVNYALEPGVAKSLGSVDLAKMTKVSATAAHQYSNKVLSGTDVTFDLGQASASSLNLTIKKTDNTATRSAAALKSAYSSDSDWPYLPQGAYTFSGSFSSNGVNVTVPATSFSVPAPSGLSVAEFTPFTSYSKYLDKKPKEANALDGSTIYVDVTININSSIVGNTNYSDVILVNGSKPVYNADKTCVCFGGNDWKSHTISQITWTFDGVTASHKLEAAKTVHVTGIPYSYNFYNNQSNATSSACPWTLTNTYWTIGKCCVFYSEVTSSWGKETTTKYDGYIHSPRFYIPENVTVNLNCSSQAQYYVLMGGTTALDVSGFSAQIKVGATSATSVVSSAPVTHTINASKNPSDSFYNPVSELTMTNSLSYISIHHNAPSRPSKKVGSGIISWTEYAVYWYINIGEIKVEYR